MFRKVRLRFLISFIKCILIKIRYGNRAMINPLRLYISPGAKIKITNGGRIYIKGNSDRVFLSKNTVLHCSGGELTIGNGVFFNENNHVICHKKLTIGDDCLFGQNVCFYDSDHEFRDNNKKIRDQGYTKAEVSISKDVWIGAGSVVTKGTSIGTHTVIGANSVVRGNLDSYSIYAGNPVRYLRKVNEK